MGSSITEVHKKWSIFQLLPFPTVCNRPNQVEPLSIIKSTHPNFILITLPPPTLFRDFFQSSFYLVENFLLTKYNS